MGWRVWRKEVVASLWLHILSVPEFFNVFFSFLFEYYLSFDLWVEVNVSDDK